MGCGAVCTGDLADLYGFGTFVVVVVLRLNKVSYSLSWPRTLCVTNTLPTEVPRPSLIFGDRVSLLPRLVM